MTRTPTTAHATARVIATAGHVDHGKSTLVRALTGIEPDRWAEERRRGLSIGLGFAWTTLPSGIDLAFVDVPGHERFLSTMLSGIGSVPALMFVVAADEGWSAQSQEHLELISALRVRHAVLAITKSDRVERGRIDAVAADASERLAAAGLDDLGERVAAVSAVTGDGLDELTLALDKLISGMPEPSPDQPVRFWLDRSFAIAGVGTVVTGTLGQGRLAVGDELAIAGLNRTVSIRGLQSEGRECGVALPVRRVAVGLRGIDHHEIIRGQALVSRGAWIETSTFDTATTEAIPGALARSRPLVHIGSAAVRCHLRLLDERHARLQTQQPLALHVGDRIVVRDPGSRIALGMDVVDVDPPALRGSGSARRRVADLTDVSVDGEVRRRGVVPADWLRAAGWQESPSSAVRIGGFFVAKETFAGWRGALVRLVADQGGDVSLETARQMVAIPDPEMLSAVVAAQTDLVVDAGRIVRRDATWVRSAGVVELINRLRVNAFDAPDAGELASAKLDRADLARAVRDGEIQAIAAGIYLGPHAVEEAERRLQSLGDGFTVSQAAAAIGVSRRVGIPLLEHLDRLRITRRAADGTRSMQRTSAGRDRATQDD